MATLLTTLFIVALLPFIAKAPLVWAMHRAGGYDNHYPRQQQSRLTGFGQRCNAAHYNCFEALAVYLAAMLAVVAASLVTTTVIWLAWGFVAARIAYLICYWFDWASARSIAWLLGMVMASSMLLLAIQAL
ncbi:MAPEG family protein [Arsukibacterium sp.]|uniref:MAPEG family protein n=1 Tax=Arsukibacterium sp. TaxID=1977258 RepID=UPI002FD99E20